MEHVWKNNIISDSKNEKQYITYNKDSRKVEKKTISELKNTEKHSEHKEKRNTDYDKHKHR